MNRILSTARRQCASSVFREALGSSKMRPGRAAYINRNGILRKVKPENRSISSNTAQVVEMPSNARNDSIFASRDGSGHNDALSCKSTLELIRALVVFRLCTIPVFVQHSRTMYDASRNLFGQRFVDAIVKNSFFAHFCGGESEEELAGMVKKLQEKGIGSILDYAAETEIETSNGILTSTESSAYDENTASMLKSISSVSRVKARSSDESFAALKVTALGDPVLLRDASTVIRSIINVFKKMDANETGFLTIEALNRAFTATGTILDNEKSNEIFRRIDTDNDGKIFLIDYVDSLFPTTEDSTSIGFFKDSFALPEFGPTQTKALRDVAKRLETIAKHAEDCGVTVMVDAEHTFMQPAIDQLTLQAMRRHNKARPTVFNTYQCYLRDSMPRVLDDLARARRGGFVFGAKIVRGAYMLQERRLAAEEGRPDPIHPDIDATHRNYHAVLDVILSHKLQSGDGTAVMVATHNEDSIRYALDRQRALGLPSPAGVYFAQLLGMRDHLSFALGRAGCSIYKYVPYGPVREVLPYLLRRAEENADIFSGVEADRAAHRAELARRLRAAFAAGRDAAPAARRELRGAPESPPAMLMGRSPATPS